MKKNPAPFVRQARPGHVTAGDVIGAGGREVRVVSVHQEGRPLSAGHRVWGIDDRGEAVLAEWSGTSWRDQL